MSKSQRAAQQLRDMQQTIATVALLVTTPGAAEELQRISERIQALVVQEGTVQEQAACGKCQTPFDADDPRYPGRARYTRVSRYCRSCVYQCHDTEIADHRCVICA